MILAAALWLIPTSAMAQFEDVEILTTHVAGGIYMLEGRGGNLGVSTGADGVVLVDDQYAPSTDRIVAAIAAIDDGPLRFVINTHWHIDHTGGNEQLGAAGAVVVAHDKVRHRMSTEQFIASIDRRFPPSPPAALPVVTFSEGVTLHLNGEAIAVRHTPRAHTDGDSIVHFPVSNVIHMGDIFFHGMYPLVDRSSGGTVQGMIDAVQQALALCDGETRVIPGHGPLANCAQLESYGQMLADASEAVRALMARGLKREQVIAARPSAPWDARHGGGFVKPDRFVGFLYDSLAEARGGGRPR